MTKKLALALGVLAFLVTAGGSAWASANGAQKCAAAKKKLAGKKASGLLKCDSQAAAQAAAVDTECTGAARTRFSAAWDGVEAKYPLAAPDGCKTTNDESAIEGKVDQLQTYLDSNLHVTGATPSLCTAAKFKDAGKLFSCMLKCHQKAQLKALPVDATSVQKCKDQFATRFAKDETKGDCRSTNDMTTIRNQMVADADDVASELPTGVTTTTTSTSTSTTAVGAIRCCQATGACLDANDPALTQKCAQLGGTVAPSGQRCNATTGLCGSGGPVHGANCCQCPSNSPPFPHPQYCFETNSSSCGPVCTKTAGAQCGTVTETCGGS